MKKAKDLDMKCAITGDTLILNGIRYPKGNLDSLPDSLSPINLSSKTDDNNYAFYGNNNPLSNFFCCSFMVEGVEYSSVEQFYQHKKALFFKDSSAAEQIMSSQIPSVQKALGRKINSFNEEKWSAVAPEVMHSGLISKFTQSQDLMRFLIKTGNKYLIKASPHDLVWGSGLSLSSGNCLYRSKHNGKNQLGEILSTVRSQLISSDGLGSSQLMPSPMMDT
jgi:hypothetical protein